MLNAGFHGTDFVRILRFFTILVSIPLFFNIQFSERIKITIYNFFIFFSVIKSLVIIGIEIWCITTDGWEIMRRWCFKHNLGDVYPSSYFIYKIQIIGNPLILFAFIMHFTKTNKFDFVTLILLSGVVFVGNFAFLLGLFGFFTYRIYRILISQKNRRGYFTPIVFFFFALFFMLFLLFTLKQTREKSDYSNVVRIQQIRALIDCNFFLGEGLGNYIKVNAGLRQYDGDIYFELQTFYIFNQIGIIGLILFYLLTIYQCYWIENVKFEKVALYLIYLLYSFWNPYCFDSTQMLVILFLGNFDLGGINHEHNLSCNSILSK